MQFDKTAILLEPDSIALDYSRQLQQLISNEILHSGPMTFARFMELALYAPGLGYYSAGSKKFGKEGDFVTAPELSPLFSLCLAKQCAQVLAETKGDVLEFGAGSGKMAGVILAELEQLGTLPNHYFILEVSADLKERQQVHLRQAIPHLFDRIQWLEQLPTNFRGICLANEVLDAFPVSQFENTKEGFKERFVDIVDQRFSAHLQEPSPALRNHLLKMPSDLPLGYKSECNLSIEGWLKALSGVVDQGLVLIIDYGFPRSEYYHPERAQGTFICHYRHRAFDDPFANIGLQDMTAHVDFTHVIEAAHETGFELLGYTNQANFLMSCGIIDYLSQITNQDKHLKLAAELKVLTIPSEMGEIFKVMALGKQLNLQPLGFSLRDYSDRL